VFVFHKLGTLLGSGAGIVVLVHSFLLGSLLSERPIPPTFSALPAMPLEELENRGRMITVRISTGDLWGSGILLWREGSNYFVLTNQHVLDLGDSYQVETYDQMRYPAYHYPTVQFENVDLGVLVFNAGVQSYALGTLGYAASLHIGEPVLGLGFPLNLENPTPSLHTVLGQIIYTLDNPFAKGYQIGYSSAILKGMSGGPVLNMAGEVVAVNGVHAQALWGDPYIFDDGTNPCPPLKNLMRENSWAIPIEVAQRQVFGTTFPPMVAAIEKKIENELQLHLQTTPALPGTLPILPEENQPTKDMGHQGTAYFSVEYLLWQADRVSQCLE